MSHVAEVFWVLASTFIFVAYLVVLLQIVRDLLRDPQLGGGAKALWVVGLIFIPVFTALLYLIVRGRGMTERQKARQVKARAATDARVRRVAGAGPSDQIAKAKSLLDSGAISQDEFLALKKRALSEPHSTLQ